MYQCIDHAARVTREETHGQGWWVSAAGKGLEAWGALGALGALGAVEIDKERDHGMAMRVGNNQVGIGGWK